MANASLASVGELEGELLKILEHVGNGLTVIDPQGRFLFANEDAARALGFASARELLAARPDQVMDRFELIDETGKPLASEDAPTRRALQGQSAAAKLLGFRRKGTAEERWALVTATPVLSAGGAVRYVVNLFQDVTAQRRADLGARFLASASSRLASAVPDAEKVLAEVAQLAVPGFADWCAVDLADGHRLHRVAVAHVNPEKVKFAFELEQRYPAPQDESNGMIRVLRSGKSELYPEIPAQLVEQSAQDAEHLRVIRELQLHSAIVVPLTARGKTLGVITFVWAESRRNYGPADLGLAEDLGRRAGMAVANAQLFSQVKTLTDTLEHRVAERTAELQDANRELEAFSYSVSHDLRAPLRHVAGFVELLDQHARAQLDEKGQHYLDTIRGASRRAGELVDALLAFSRLGRAPLALSPVNLNEVVADVRAELEPELAGREVRFLVGELPWVPGDAALVRLIFQNLIGNAVKFTARTPGAQIEISAHDEGLETVITVRDNGAGFDPRYGDKLFGVFQRLHSEEEFEGTGIGLATVRRIVARHGGRIWAEGQPGRGAAFHFTLTHPPEVAR